MRPWKRVAASWGRGLIDPLLDLVYPPRCLACGKSLYAPGRRELCESCRGTIRMITDQRCSFCGEQLGPHAPRDQRCPNCRDLPLVFRRATAPCKHEGAVRELVLNLKYKRQMAALRPLSRLLIGNLAHAPFIAEVDVIVPVPLHRRQRWARGFNQAELLARCVGRHFALPVCATQLRRIRATPSQAQLTRTERLRNLNGAFRVKDRAAVAGKTILLCDDVMTTGATASECSRALRDAGARRIYVSVVTR